MILNVFNTESGNIEKVDVKNLNPEIHVHRNSIEKFSKEDLASFGYKAK